MVASVIVTVVLILGAVTAARYAPGGWIGRLVARPGSETAAPQQLAQLSIGGPFTLVDPAGRTVTPADFKGRWMLVYFGYTTCPDVCPTTLQSIAGALAKLGPAASNVVPLFITIDPARDRPDVIGRYTALFDKRIIGLTGSQAQVTQAETAYRVYAARVDQAGTGSYLMDHTSFVYLIDPQGHLAALFDHDVTASALAERLRRALP